MRAPGCEGLLGSCHDNRQATEIGTVVHSRGCNLGGQGREQRSFGLSRNFRRGRCTEARGWTKLMGQNGQRRDTSRPPRHILLISGPWIFPTSPGQLSSQTQAPGGEEADDTSCGLCHRWSRIGHVPSTGNRGFWGGTAQTLAKAQLPGWLPSGPHPGPRPWPLLAAAQSPSPWETVDRGRSSPGTLPIKLTAPLHSYQQSRPPGRSAGQH